MGEKLYEEKDNYYTMEMFIIDTGEDHKKIWKEAFIDKSTNFFDKGEPTSTETSNKTDNDKAHELYNKAKAHGDKIAKAEAALIKAKADAMIKAAEATKEKRVAEETEKYVKENTLTHGEAVKIVTQDAEKQNDAAHEENQNAIKKQAEEQQAENENKRKKEESTRENQLKENFESGDKRCADGPDKVVSLINNSITDFIKKTAEQETNRVKEANQNVDAYVESKSKEQGEKQVTKLNNAILELTRSEVAMKKKMEQKLKTDAFTNGKTSMMKFMGQIGL